MSMFYQFAYQVGFRPWERESALHGHEIAAVLDQVEAGRTQPFGPALDLGCGTGIWTTELARRGWQAVGIDNVARALRAATQREEAVKSGARFVNGSVTALRDSNVGSGFRLLLDIGCFHGLSDGERAAMAREVAAVAADGAELVLLAFTPGSRGPLPRGASPEDLERVFAGWRIIGTYELPGTTLPGPLKNAKPTMYRLKKVE